MILVRGDGSDDAQQVCSDGWVKNCLMLTRNRIRETYQDLLEVCRQLVSQFESEGVLRNQSV
jgi:hypothetical protein